MDILILIAVLTVIVLVTISGHINSRRCPKCDRWRKTTVTRLDSTDILLEHPGNGVKTVIYVYKCNQCGNRWEGRDYESTD